MQELYLESLEAIGIDLRKHDIKFEEDNWEWPGGGAWGVGWQVMLDGLEITQFTYFQQCGGMDLDPICAELTYGLERIARFCRTWTRSTTSCGRAIRRPARSPTAMFGWPRSSSFRPTTSNTPMCAKLWEHFDLYEAESQALLEQANACSRTEGGSGGEARFPLLATYELALKCSHLFNLLDARGAISVTERVGVMARIRALAIGVAKAYVEQGAALR